MTLCDVAPVQASRYEADHGYGDPKTLREMALGVTFCKASADFPDVCIRQLRTAVPRPERLPTFRHHIGRVVSIRAKEQMAGVDAGRAVASVANTHACRYLPDEERIGDAMRSLCLHVRAPAGSEGSVPIIEQPADPNKAFARRDRLRKQPEHGVRSVMIPLSQVSLLSGSLVRPGCDVSGIVPGRVYSISGG